MLLIFESILVPVSEITSVNTRLSWSDSIAVIFEMLKNDPSERLSSNNVADRLQEIKIRVFIIFIIRKYNWLG